MDVIVIVYGPTIVLSLQYILLCRCNSTTAFIFTRPHLIDSFYSLFNNSCNKEGICIIPVMPSTITTNITLFLQIFYLYTFSMNLLRIGIYLIIGQ